MFLLHLTQKLLVSFDFVSDRCPQKAYSATLCVCVCRGSPEDHNLYSSGCLRMGILEGINTFRLLMDFPRFSCGTRGRKDKSTILILPEPFLFLPTSTSRVRTPNGFLGQRKQDNRICFLCLHPWSHFHCPLFLHVFILSSGV